MAYNKSADGSSMKRRPMRRRKKVCVFCGKDNVIDYKDTNKLKKRLAYEIQHMTEAFYYFIQFDAEGTVPAEIEQDVRIMDNVLRFLCVRKDEA